MRSDEYKGVHKMRSNEDEGVHGTRSDEELPLVTSCPLDGYRMPPVIVDLLLGGYSQWPVSACVELDVEFALKQLNDQVVLILSTAEQQDSARLL